MNRVTAITTALICLGATTVAAACSGDDDATEASVDAALTSEAPSAVPVTTAGAPRVVVTLTEPAALVGTYDSAAIATTDDVVCQPLGRGGFFVSFVPIGADPAALPAGLSVLAFELLAGGPFEEPGRVVGNLRVVTPPAVSTSYSVQVERTTATSGSFTGTEPADPIAGSWEC